MPRHSDNEIAARFPKYKSISRVDRTMRNQHGWLVRVVFQGEMHQKFFTDSVHGGPEKGLAKALRFRNQIEKQVGKPRTDRTVSGMPARTNTGMKGVRRTFKDGCPVFEITWSPTPGTLCRTSVAIEKNGEEAAWQRAVKIRLSKEREILGKALSAAPEDGPLAPEKKPVGARPKKAAKTVAAKTPAKSAAKATKSATAPAKAANASSAEPAVKATKAKPEKNTGTTPQATVAVVNDDKAEKKTKKKEAKEPKDKKQKKSEKKKEKKEKQDKKKKKK